MPLERVRQEFQQTWHSLLQDRWVLVMLVVSAFLATGIFSCSPP
jgi:hypothetical protein